MPGWLRDLFTPGVIVGFTIVSVVLIVGSLLALPRLVASLPADYFVREEAGLIADPQRRKWLLLGKNLLGIVLLIAGLAMLVLPGQGVLTLLVAVALLDFPGKRRLEQRIARAPRVLAALNSMRKKRGRPPFAFD
jgi:hypothetical protein